MGLPPNVGLVLLALPAQPGRGGAPRIHANLERDFVAHEMKW